MGVLSGRISETSFAGFFAAAVSSALFAMAHLYQGRRAIITTFVVGILFSTVRIWTGNIVPAIVGHIGVDLVAGLYAPRALRTRPDRVAPTAPTAGEH